MPEDEQFDDAGGFKPSQPPNKLEKNQKIAAASLAVFAVLIIILWFAQLRSNIYGPFNSLSGQNQIAADEQTGEEALKNKDTDGDGLSDYDELNFYNTSPYLEDTDSDGFKDGDEIKNNADPNCPAGRDCSGGLLSNYPASQAASTTGAALSPEAGLNNLTNQNEVLNNLLNQFNATEPQTTSGSAAASLNSDQLNVLKNIDAASLRALLLENGMDKATLDKISDADLIKSFQETMNGQ